MSSLIQALDSKQMGENGTYEHTWAANSLKDQLVKIHFQLNRKNLMLSENLYLLLSELKQLYDEDSKTTHYKEYITMFYKMIGYTRDIVDGKGEYELTFLMIRYFYMFFPELTMQFIPTLVQHNDFKHPYGSWKDLKYLCFHCKNSYSYDNYTTLNMYDKIIEKCCILYNEQLKKDYENVNNSSYNISLVAKWIPRENKKFGWLFYQLAESYFQNYMKTAKTLNQKILAKKKCYTEYRHIISLLNKKLDTLQIKQCENNWSNINFNNVTSISMIKQKNAFLNRNKNGDVKHKNREDRLQCANNFVEYLNDKNTHIKGKRVSTIDFTKEALNMIRLRQDYKVFYSSEIKLLNKQWEDNRSQNGKLGKMIAMVDTSASMEGEPLFSAIALGIRIAEMSSLGKRIMTFSATPCWVNLENVTDFVSCVEKISKANWGMNTNFFAAMNLILDAIIETNLNPCEVKDMVLVILSDMQIDEANVDTKKSTMYDKIKKKYEEVGMKLYGEPLIPPHILFWNLRSTNGFPNLTTEKNTSMMSGNNPALLNVFCEEGMEALTQLTPWELLKKILRNKRYSILQNFADDFLHKF